jgi:hypothetical protein
MGEVEEHLVCQWEFEGPLHLGRRASVDVHQPTTVLLAGDAVAEDVWVVAQQPSRVVEVTAEPAEQDHRLVRQDVEVVDALAFELGVRAEHPGDDVSAVRTTEDERDGPHLPLGRRSAGRSVRGLAVTRHPFVLI